MTPPSRQTSAGQVYLDLRRLALTTGRATDEPLQLYELEGYLDRLACCPWFPHEPSTAQMRHRLWPNESV